MATETEPIVLRERQASDIGAHLALELLKDSTFNALLDGGMLELVRSRQGKFALKGAQYVGRATLSCGRELIITEKVSGAIAGMLPWASPRDIRSLLIQSHITESSDMLEIIVDLFLKAVAEYISKGTTKIYSRDCVSTLNPRGKVDVTATVRLRSKGIYGRITCRPSRLTGLTQVNSLIALALLCLDGCQGILPLGKDKIALARAFLPYFAECDFHSLRRMALPVRVSQFERELRSPFITLEQQKVLGYGRAIALHALSTFGSKEIAEIPGAYFINLESLFEDSVLSCLQDCLDPIKVWRPQELDRLNILDGANGRYRASPDALWEAIDKQLLIADCKYKLTEGSPGHSDIYQILAHAEAYRATGAILFYPSDNTAMSFFGSSRGGTRVWSASLRCNHLREDIETAIKQVYDFKRRELALLA